uniref:TATA element modulatory factor 1 TATA binding domain-containing protein n=1 Tax=Trypanosoma congolense (strain IL3000) TaxID=1068625 RepID=G0V071_TRYCI|nr:conserved hypothetical protein [Trypanosoma congolense IL3000]
MIGSWLTEIQRKLDTVSGLTGVREGFDDARYENDNRCGGAAQLAHDEVTGVNIENSLPQQDACMGCTDSTGHNDISQSNFTSNTANSPGQEGIMSTLAVVKPSNTDAHLTKQKLEEAGLRKRTLATLTEECGAYTPPEPSQSPLSLSGGHSLSMASPDAEIARFKLCADVVVDSNEGHQVAGTSGDGGDDEVCQGGDLGVSTFPASKCGAEGQLLRLQQLLAVEMESSRRLREENENLAQSLVVLQKETDTLRRSGLSSHDREKLTSLEREGLQLSEQLGRERERTKLLLEEKTRLGVQVASQEKRLEEEIARYNELQKCLDSEQWERGVAQQRVIELTFQLGEKDCRIKGLEKELSRYISELDDHRLNTNDVMESLKQEKDAFMTSLQRSQVEHKLQIKQLEEKLGHAECRADQAETRLAEHERDTLGSLRELRAALDDTEHQKRQLLQQMARTAEECASLRRDHIADMEMLQRKLFEVQGELQGVQDEKKESIQELLLWKGKYLQATKELDEAVKRATHAEVVNEQLKPKVQQPKQQIDDIGSSASDNTVSQRSPAPAPRDPFRGLSQFMMPNHVCEVNTGVSLVHFGGDVSGNDIPRGSRERIERELVRQAVEIEDLRRYKDEAEEAKKSLAALAAQHDLLMQMYGQLQEELHEQNRVPI